MEKIHDRISRCKACNRARFLVLRQMTSGFRHKATLLRCSLAAALLLGWIQPLTAAALYSVTTLDPYFFGGAINNAGQVAGAIYLPASNSDHAALYSNGQTQDLGTLPGFTNSGGLAINNAGQVTGSSSTIEPERGRAFVYSNGQIRDLGSLSGPPYPYSYGAAINDAGQVAGFSYDMYGNQHAVIYSNGVFQDLGSLAGVTSSRGDGINNAGQVTGTLNLPGVISHAFLYSNGQIQDLGTPAGFANSYGLAINNTGQVLGEATTPSDITHALLYSGGQVRDLGTFDVKGSSTFPSALNNSGQVVGRYTTFPDDPFDTHAFFYSDGQLTDLNNLIDPTLGITLEFAESINDNGQILASSETTHRSYLLTPVPEPSTGILLGVPGLLLLAASLRRWSNWRARSANP